MIANVHVSAQSFELVQPLALLTTLPPSTVIVAPLIYAPALELKNKQAPATSSGVPILPRGMPASMISLKLSKVCFIILL